VSASNFTEAAAAIEGISEQGRGQPMRFRPLIDIAEKDIRLNLRAPFPREVADNLSVLIRVALDHVVEDLAAAPATVSRPVTAPAKLTKLQNDATEILDDIEEYALLADHHYNAEVRRLRTGRTTDEVSKEIGSIATQGRNLKTKIVDYLQDLQKCLSGPSI
jgi:hypothetical protein